MAQSLVLNRKRQVPAEDTPAFGGIAERFRRGVDLDRAVELCQDGLKKFPDHLSARVTLGWSLLDLGRYEEAREALESALKRAPDNLAAIRGLAELHDRAEHTMVLPMDGPGQWPPDDATIEGVETAQEAGAAPADIPWKSDGPLSLDSLLARAGAGGKSKGKGKKNRRRDEDGEKELAGGAETQSAGFDADVLADAVLAARADDAPASVEPAASGDLDRLIREMDTLDRAPVPGTLADDGPVDLGLEADSDIEKAIVYAQAAARAAEEHAAAQAAARAEEHAAARAAEEHAAAHAAAQAAALAKADERAVAQAAALAAAEEQAVAQAAARAAAEERAAAESAARAAAEERAGAEAVARAAVEERAGAEAAARASADQAAARAAADQAAAEVAARVAAERAAAEALERAAGAEEAARAAEKQAATEVRKRAAAEQAAAEAVNRAVAAEAAARAVVEYAAAEAAARAAAERAAAEAAVRAAEELAAAEAAGPAFALTNPTSEDFPDPALEALAAELAELEADEAAAAARPSDWPLLAALANEIALQPLVETGPVFELTSPTPDDFPDPELEQLAAELAELAEPAQPSNLPLLSAFVSGPAPLSVARPVGRQAVPVLESLLKRVGSRRAELMSESVA